MCVCVRERERERENASSCLLHCICVYMYVTGERSDGNEDIRVREWIKGQYVCTLSCTYTRAHTHTHTHTHKHNTCTLTHTHTHTHTHTQNSQDLKHENKRLKDENSALIRVIGKLSRAPLQQHT